MFGEGEHFGVADIPVIAYHEINHNPQNQKCHRDDKVRNKIPEIYFRIVSVSLIFCVLKGYSTSNEIVLEYLLKYCLNSHNASDMS